MAVCDASAVISAMRGSSRSQGDRHDRLSQQDAVVYPLSKSGLIRYRYRVF